ncbi:hypothetical protein CW705_03325 [Candidatus Bathyarchaeota archaeon]|nr:MAG: hypothetical protein CW705_03325 [Candidatus Bathyarchaeota archaeon]
MPLLEVMLDERAERSDIDMRVIGSGAKLGPEQCREVSELMIKLNPDLVILIGPAQTTPGPSEARKMLREAGLPTIVISDFPAKKLVDEMEKSGLGYIIVEADSMIGARREFLREKVRIKNLKLGCLLTARRSIEDAIARVKDAWDFFFMRLEEKSLPALEQIAKECKRLDKPIYAYFVVGTPRNAEIIKMIGWPVTTTMEKVEEFAAKLEGTLDGIIATCVGDYEGDKELLEKLQKFREK